MGVSCSYETALRARESDKMDDDDGWWAYNYPKNLDKQDISKLIVAQTVPSLRVCYDADGTKYINNVRVNGISTPDAETAWFLLAVLNGPVADFVFRRIAKPKDGGWFEANKQFIAPLPIPYATTEEKADTAARAERLQKFHTARRDVLEDIARRLSAAPVKRRPDSFLFPDLIPAKARFAEAPKNLDSEEQRAWAKARYEEALQARYAAIGERLHPGSELDATFAQGELSFLADGVPVIERIFLANADGTFVAAQWKVIASTFTVPDEKAGERLCNELRKLRETDNSALREQVIALQAELSEAEASISTEEAAMNAVLYRLYALTKGEIALVEKDRRLGGG